MLISPARPGQLTNGTPRAVLSLAHQPTELVLSVPLLYHLGYGQRPTVPSSRPSRRGYHAPPPHLFRPPVTADPRPGSDMLLPLPLPIGPSMAFASFMPCGILAPRGRVLVSKCLAWPASNGMPRVCEAAPALATIQHTSYAHTKTHDGGCLQTIGFR